MKLFKCQHCEQLLYFENTVCEKCCHRLGFIPEIMIFRRWSRKANVWRALAVEKKTYQFCANAAFDVCNWMVDAVDRPILHRLLAQSHHPGHQHADNVVAWRKIEIAKHRLFYTLMKLNLPLDEKNDDGTRGSPSTFLQAPIRPAVRGS